MSAKIEKVAVIGSGVMGSAIAAHIANAGVPVFLFDIVPDDAGPNKGRTRLAEEAIEKIKKSDPAMLTHKSRIKLIKPANLEDDLSLFGEVDWIIEAVLERIDVKQKLYQKVNLHRKRGSIISSNTSTIPLHALVEGMPDAFKHDFLISHFFNPPRYMRLMELVGGKETHASQLEVIRKFADVRLGKGVVECKDTPGFIANRIGIFWLETALLEAIKQQIPVEVADLVMSKPVGIPRTGVFGLMDLIGIDLLPLIAKSFKANLKEGDEFLKIYQEPEVITNMINDGYTGRKGKGGFYRLAKNADGKKTKEAKNLITGEYAPAIKPKLESVEAAKEGLRSLVTNEDPAGKYAWIVLRNILHYTASLIPEISDDITSVDEAMRLGYNWKWGPFELIDKLGSEDMAGPKWFAGKLRAEGLSIPEIIQKAGDKPLYQILEGKKQYATIEGGYKKITHSPEAWMLADVKETGAKPVIRNASANLWDIGDGIACLEFSSKMNSLDPMSLEMVVRSTEKVKESFAGLVIANDSDNFCVGANIGVLLFASNVAAWKVIDGIIKQGQEAYMGLKYSPFPVVSAPSGLALGGGCEMLLHSDAVQAHIETYTGLVEVGVGVLPGWGGCKEMLYRNLAVRAKSDSVAAKLGGMFSFLSPVKTLNTFPAIEESFRNIATARVSKSAEEARDMLILNEKSRITMNRKRLLPDAKELCLMLAKKYVPPVSYNISLPGRTARAALDMGIRGFEKSGKATPHDVVVSKMVARVLSGGKTSITKELTEQEVLDLEREAFVELVKKEGTLARIEHMLETGKPLRN